jgi:ribose-phosphate pyrophosphokinase
MSLGIVVGTANPVLAEGVASRLGTRVVEMQLERFPDGEIRPRLGPIRGADIYVIQPTGPPVNDNLVELLLLLDTCRRAGADRVTAVIPYFGYARQDRRAGDRRPIAARVVAEAIAGAGAGRLVVVDPHTSSLEAMFGVPVEMLTAVPVLAAAARPLIPDHAVVVAPDLGAMRLARHFASLVEARLAAVSKYRLDAVTVSATDIVGEVRNRPVVIVDDMISTGATIEAAVNALRAHGAAGEPIAVATHGLFAGSALPRLGECGIGHMVVTDSIAPRPAAAHAAPALSIQTESIAGLLAEAIDRLHHSEPLEELLLRG